MCLWHFQLLTEGADHGCPFIHHSCCKPCSRRGMRVPGVLPKLWDPVHEPGKYSLHSQQFSVCPAVMFLCCRVAKVCTFFFVTAWSKFVLDEWILMKWIICDEYVTWAMNMCLQNRGKAHHIPSLGPGCSEEISPYFSQESIPNCLSHNQTLLWFIYPISSGHSLLINLQCCIEFWPTFDNKVYWY